MAAAKSTTPGSFAVDGLSYIAEKLRALDLQERHARIPCRS